MKPSILQNHTLFTTSTLGSAERYWFRFQGQEAENEIWGEGNASFYKYRISDNRLGRFFAVDPLAPEYPYWSPYAFSGNRVIDCVELEGLQPGSYVATQQMGYARMAALGMATQEDIFNVNTNIALGATRGGVLGMSMAFSLGMGMYSVVSLTTTSPAPIGKTLLYTHGFITSVSTLGLSSAKFGMHLQGRHSEADAIQTSVSGNLVSGIADFLNMSEEAKTIITAGANIFEGAFLKGTYAQLLTASTVIQETANIIDNKQQSNTYIIQSGDTLSVIAQRFGPSITVDSLAKANSIEDINKINAGDSLIIQ